MCRDSWANCLVPLKIIKYDVCKNESVWCRLPTPPALKELLHPLMMAPTNIPNPDPGRHWWTELKWRPDRFVLNDVPRIIEKKLPELNKMMIIEIRNHPLYPDWALRDTWQMWAPGVTSLVTTSYVSRRHSWQQFPRHRLCDTCDRMPGSDKCATDSIGCGGKKLHPAAANKVPECSVLMRKGERNSMQKSIWVTVINISDWVAWAGPISGVSEWF